jgi:hypothetical protein
LDSFAGNADSDPGSWISKIYKTVSGESGTDQVHPEGLTDPDTDLQVGSIEGLESPILEESWTYSDSSVESGKS